MSKVRQERTAELIQVILSELFLREVSDPRLAGVTVTQVLIDRELQHRQFPRAIIPTTGSGSLFTKNQ